MKLKIALIGIVMALIGAFFWLDLSQYFSLTFLKEQKEALDILYTQKPFLMAFVFFVVYISVTALALPAAVILTLAGGAIFGFINGMLLVSFASSIGATLAFIFTRFLFHDTIEAKYGHRLTGINAGIERDGAFYVFGMRLVPFIPFVVINSVLALTKIKIWTFYWSSQLGMLAGTAVYVNAGTQLAKIDSLSAIANPSLIASFILLGVFPVVAKWMLTFLKTQKKTLE